jgi:hypothetical protein
VAEARDHRNHEIEEIKEFLRAYRVEGEVRDHTVAAIAFDEKRWQVKSSYCPSLILGVCTYLLVSKDISCG